VNRRPLAVDFGGDANGSADDGADTARGLAVATAADGDRSISLLDATGEARWTTTPVGHAPELERGRHAQRPVLALGGANGNLETIDVSDGGTRYEVGLQDLPSPSATQTPVASTSAGAAASGRSTCSTEKSSGNSSTRRRYAGKRSRCRGRDRRRLSGPGRGESGWRRARTEPEGRGDRPRQYRYRRRVRGPLFADVTGDGSAEVLIVAEDGRIVALSD